MQPLDPDLRSALRRAHDGLTDERIDHLQDLLSLRFSLDPRAEPDLVKAVDDRVRQLIATEMPHYAAALQTIYPRG